MASALPNHYLSFSLLSPSTRFPSKSTNVPKTLAFARTPSPRSLASQVSRRRFGGSLRAAETEPETVNEEENQVPVDQPENKEEQEDLPSMKVLVQAYKKAILDGDEKGVSEIEAAIRLVKNEKNRLSLKFVELTTEIASGKSNFLRLKADFENYRKRTEKDHLSLTSNARGEVIESLLPLVDSFERAKQNLNPETEKEKKIDTSYQGIYKQFVEIMRCLRVAVVGTVGKPFDPSVTNSGGNALVTNLSQLLESMRQLLEKSLRNLGKAL
ncbi:uncharacterized protein LOC109824441 isoform X2 [Asparagus officinalis]|uniref:uncharacterized protein LOC109824441 isoform X2 n=1 Tax=Asparagus officinalis TaxID=4686 RepID=UPI00098E06A6|nr:uncharacterized protein LOC109824441 isoform X2 [Asparagus officinalis]